MKTRTIQLKVIVVLVAMLTALALCLTACAPDSSLEAKSASVTLIERNALASGENVVKYDTASSVPTERHGNYYLVRTVQQMRYVLTTEDSNQYLLMNDFVVEDGSWASHNSDAPRTFTLSGKGYDSSWNETGANHTLTFRPNASDTTVKSTSAYGGLFGVFDGVLQDLTYKFEGRLECDLNAAGVGTAYYGSLAGVLSGTIQNCTVSYSGTISAYGNANGKTVYAGGIAGQMKGATLTDTIVYIGGAVYARNMVKDDDSTSKNCKNYAGGLAGLMSDSGTSAARPTTLSGCDVSMAGSIYANDLGAVSGFGQTIYVTGQNGAGYYFVSGGLAGEAGSAALSNNKIKLTGRVYSTGGTYSSVDGGAAGGLFGLTSSGATLSIQNNVFTLGMTVRCENQRAEGLGGGKHPGNTVLGGLIGRMLGSATASGLKGNAFYYQANLAVSASDNADGKDFYGYVVGVGNNFGSFNGGNNWFVYRGGADSDTGYVTDIPTRQTSDSSGNESNNTCGNLGRLLVYGGGEVEVSVNQVTNRLVFEAKQQYSPFYRWLTNMGGNVALTNASEVSGSTFSPSSTTGVLYAVFLTREIDDSGKYVQWTEEMRSGLNFSWNTVSLTADVTVTKGVNLLDTYSGTFEGNGHTVTFGNGVVMYGKDVNQDEAVVVGLFGRLGSSGTVRNLNVTFAGTLYGGDQSANSTDDNYSAAVYMGLIAGVNEGTITNINVTLSQAAKLVALGRNVTLGGLIGHNKGSVSNIVLTIDGTLQSNAEVTVVGGLIGLQAEQSGGVTFDKINVDLRGQLVARQRDNAYQAVNCKMGGLIGVSQAALTFSNVAVNVRDVSNFTGDVLTMGCTHNTDAYSGEDGLLDVVNEWTISNSATKIPEILDALNDVNVALASQVTYHEVMIELTNVQARGIQVVASEKDPSLSAQNYFTKYIKNPILSLDSGAPCSTCSGNCHKAEFVANHDGYNYALSNTWALGTFKQYPDRSADYSTELGVRALPYFGSEPQSTATVSHLNFIFVRDGSAVATMNGDGSFVFSVPLDDDSHVFTGWYVDFDQSTMVNPSYVTTQVIGGKETSCFVPGQGQAGGVFFSSVISNLITTTAELDYLATTTKAGQRYEGVIFSLGADLTFNSAFVPIGNKTHPFGGSFDGKLHTVTLAGGFDLDQAEDGLGLFGCLDSTALVKQLTVTVSGSVSAPKKFVFGAVAGINYGTIGEGRQQDVSVNVLASVSGAKYVGGAVGQNYGLIQNLAVIVDNDSILSANGLGGDETLTAAAIAGGVVALNDGLGTVRNVQFSAPVHAVLMYEGTVIANASNALSLAGGIVGANYGNVYSGVANVYIEDDSKRLALALGTGGAIRRAGMLIGYNGDQSDIDSLWAVYSLPTAGFVLPSMDVDGAYDADLIVGQDSAKANRLIRYGYGNIGTDIYANMEGRQLKGGSIVFNADNDATNTPFYGFTMTLKGGESVDNASGETYSPQVSTISTQGVEGQTCYAVFVDSQINNKEELYALAALVNSGFQAYANYIVKLTGTKLQLLPTDPGYATIGVDYPFVGTFDSNNYAIEIRSDGASFLPLFGIIAETSGIRNLELDINASMTATRSVIYEGVEALGMLACVNLGTVNGVRFTTRSQAIGSGAVGALVGYNKGSINGTTSVVLYTDNTAGMDIAAGAKGQIAGGVVGINAQGGVIGSDMVAGVSITVYNGTVQAFVEGEQAAGAITGINYGKVLGVVVEDNGRLSSAGDVGLVAGINRGEVGAATVTATSTATFGGSSYPAHLGGVVGTNEAGATVGVTSSTIRVNWQAAHSQADGVFGGIVATNDGLVQNTGVNLTASVGAGLVGGLVGEQGLRSVLSSEVTLGQNATLTGTTHAGGLVGKLVGTVARSAANLYGVVASSGLGGGMVGESLTGATVDSCYAVLSNDLSALGSAKVGLAIGRSASSDVGVNSWAVASNRIRTLASPSQDSYGFNVLKIVGNATVIPSFVEKGNDQVGIRMTAGVISGMSMKWYQDISTLESDGYTSAVYDCQADWTNKLYHVCYYDLEIDTASEFYNLYLSINAADLFNGVMFRLNSDIVIEGQMLQPIGTKVNPFTGIFEGGYHTVTLGEGSGIAGTDYSGLFGYIAKEAVVRNFILDVKENVLLGSTCQYVGGLAGRIDGMVDSVAVHMGSDPASKLSGAKVGGLAGLVGDDARFVNTWVVVYNGGASKVGEGTSDVNCLGVLGSGKVQLTMDETALNAGNVQFVVNVTDGLSYFDAWYTDISTATTFAQSGGAGALGTYTPVGTVSGTPAFVWYRPLSTLKGSNFTLSFIGLVIRDAEDFVNFANNINTYGDQGAKFTLDLGYQASGAPQTELVVDLTEFAPIGNRKHPFTGTFDGTVPYALASSRAYTLIVKGNLTKEDNAFAAEGLADYCGLFGNVGEGALIQNLVIRADSKAISEDYQGQTIGFNGSMYTGFVASYLAGTLRNVVAVLDAGTRIVNIHDDALGGMIGVMSDTAVCNNAWLILPENSTYHSVGGLVKDKVVPYQQIATDYPSTKLPSVMYLCGDGILGVTYVYNRSSNPAQNVDELQFSLTSVSGGAPAYGFVDGTLTDPTPVSRFVSKADEDAAGKDYLAIFLNPAISSYEDLVALSDMLNDQGRSYLGVIFYLTQNITISGVDWTPIGGNVETGGGEYRKVPFIGAFDGQGYTITFARDVTCSAPYAGLFGLLSSTARISNLYVDTQATFGDYNTEYAGVIAGLDLGASLTNVIVRFGKNASLVAEIDTGRVAVNDALLYDLDGNVTNYDTVNKGVNVWVLNYNSRYNVTQNQKEKAFFDTVGTTWQGAFNGGANVVTVVAAGEMEIAFVFDGSRKVVGVRLTNPQGDSNPIKEWYSVEEGGNVSYDNGNSYTPAYDSYGKVLYASYLQDEIGNLEDLLALAIDNNDGYDLYGLTFRLTADVVIDRPYQAIGNESTPFSATFDGAFHTLTLAKDVVVDGLYAGIFGYLGDTGLVQNLKMDVKGTLGVTTYVESEIQAGKRNTAYAGAVAYNLGKLSSVIIDMTQATIRAEEMSGFAFGYDAMNYADNTWVIFNANNVYPLVGRVAGGVSSTVNSMQIVGVGSVKSEFYFDEIEGVQTHFVRMFNDTGLIGGNTYAVKGWYSDFSRDYQLSKSLKVTALESEVTAGTNGSYLAADSLINRRFEVVIMTTLIRTQAELLSIADDVNKGGYTFKNTVFTLGADIVIDDPAFTSIGSEATPFEGSFVGSFNGTYYQLVMNRYSVNEDMSQNDEGVALFGVMAGTLTDLTLQVRRSFHQGQSTIGCLTNINRGLIENCLVVVHDGVTVDGAIVGGIAGQNGGSIVNSIVRVRKGALLTALFAAGGLVGQNEGIVTGSTGGSTGQNVVWGGVRYGAFGFDGTETLQGVIASVLMEGKIEVTGTVGGNMGVGGAIGTSQNRGNVQRVTVRLAPGSKITSDNSQAALGGLVGRSTGIIANCIVSVDGVLDGNVAMSDKAGQGHDYVGYFGGNIQGTVANSWLVVPVPSDYKTVGNGSAVNVLQVSGGGSIDSYLDSDNNIIFTNLNTQGAELDGWYVGSGTAIPANVGNVDGDSFLPSSLITGWTVNVIFINTNITTVEDLNRMAQTVNAGLFAPNLVFYLQADLIINADDPLFAAIGNMDNGFKHNFYGLGHTITFQGDGAMPTGEWMGLFGYVTASATINDLHVIITGANGSAASVIGGLAAVNNGRIENCSVQLGNDQSTAVLRGVQVGGMVGSNGSTARIVGGEFHNYGMLQGLGVDNRNVFVGGVVGTNAGRIDSVRVTHTISHTQYNVQATFESNSWTGTAYAGGVSGNNTGEINRVLVNLEGAVLSANSNVIAYAGGVVGSNTGIVDSAFVSVAKDRAGNRTSISVNRGDAGGIAGINNQGLRNSMIEIFADNGSVGDSAVGGEGNNAFADNVWVYNDNFNLNSTSSEINNMTYLSLGGTPSVVHNDPVEIYTTGYIVFDAVIDAEMGLSVYADAHVKGGKPAFHSVLLDDVILYEEGALRLLPVRGTSDVEGTRGIWARAEIRRSFADETELKALAKAVRLNGQIIKDSSSGETYGLAGDVVVTGSFAPIGTLSNPFVATFSGNFHEVVFSEGVSFDSGAALFGEVGASGAIKQLVVRHQASLTDSNSAGVVLRNRGVLSNLVVYADEGVTLANSVYRSSEREGDNLWLISRSEVSLGTPDVKIIVVHGEGDVVIANASQALAGNEGLTFAPAVWSEVEEYTTFAGWTQDNRILERESYANNNFTTVGKTGESNYTAEFLSTRLGTQAQMAVLLTLLGMEYNAANVQFDMVADIDFDLSAYPQDMQTMESFRGLLDGHFYTLRLQNANTQAVFGTMRAGFIRNLVIDIRPLADDVFLWEDLSTATLQNVIVKASRLDERLADSHNVSLNMTSVYVLTDSLATVEDLDQYVTDKVGVIYTTQPDLVGFESVGGYAHAVGGEDDTHFFVGWLVGSASRAGTSVELRGETGENRIYTAKYLSSTIASAQNFEDMRQAVENGFDFAGKTLILGADLELNSATVSAPFRATFKGNGYKINWLGSNAVFGSFQGKLEGMLLIAPQAPFANASVGGVIKDSVLVTSSYQAEGNFSFDNAWVVGSRPEAAGLNAIACDLNAIEVVGLSLADEIALTVRPIDPNFYLLWTDGEDKVVVNDRYDSVVLKGTGSVLGVKASNEVSDNLDMECYGIATAHGYQGVVKLTADIALGKAYLPLTRYVALDGQRHTITILDDDMVLMQNITNLYSSVRDLRIVVKAGVNRFTVNKSARGKLINVVVDYEGDATIDFGGSTARADYENVWLLHNYPTGTDSEMGSAYIYPESVNVLRYWGGKIAVTFVESDAAMCRFTAVADEGYTFFSYYGSRTQSDETISASQVEGDRIQAKFIKQNIDSKADWYNLVGAMQDAHGDGIGRTFYLSGDLEFDDSMAALSGFAGTLDGQGNSIVITAAISHPLWTLKESGTIRNLAVEIKVAPATPITWFDQANTSTHTYYDNAWLVSYVGEVAHTEGGSITIVDNGVGQGGFTVDYDQQGFVFVPANESEYKLHTLVNKETSAVTDAERWDMHLSMGDYLANFDNCYSITIVYEGVDSAAVKPVINIDKPNLWSDDTSSNIEAVLTEGYLFLGFTYDANPAIIPGDNCMKLSVDAGLLTSSVTLTARYVSLSSDWTGMTYGDMSPAQLNDYLTLSDEVWAAMGMSGLTDSTGAYQVTRSILRNGDTLEVDPATKMPVHAGNYNVVFEIVNKADYKQVGVSVNLVFTISKKTLYFESITLSERNYDSTADARALSLVMGGLTEGDQMYQAYLNTDHVYLQYFDSALGTVTANAGTWNLIVREDSYLDCDSDLFYFQYDYDLPMDGVLYQYVKRNGVPVATTPFERTINKQVLNLTVNTVTVSFLDQFGKVEDGVLMPFDISSVLQSACTYDQSGLSEEDKAIIAKAKLLLVSGDSIVYENGEYAYRYNLRHVGNYDILPNREALQNYEPRISERTALFCIQQGKVAVRVVDTEMQYGNRLSQLNYRYFRADGVSEEEIMWDEAHFDLYVGAFANVSTFADFAAYSALDIRPICAVVEGEDMDESTLTLGTYQVKYAVGTTDSALASYEGYEPDYQHGLYIAVSDPALVVVPRVATYRLTTGSSKEFGAADTALGGRIVEGGIANGDRLVFERQAGELVGEYDVSVKVFHEDVDVSDNYALTPEREYKYYVVARTVYVKRVGNNVFHYGDDAIADMPYGLSVSDEVLSNITKALGVSSLSAVFRIKIGYFGDIHSVGEYRDITLSPDMRAARVSDEVYQNALAGIHFVLDQTSNRYTIVPQTLTVQAPDHSRDYDGTAELSGIGRNDVVVSGWINDADRRRLEVYVDGWQSDIRAEAGIYTYTPIGMAVTLKAGVTDTSLLANYTVGRVISGRYTINRLAVNVSVSVGSYDSDGTFLPAEDAEVIFGDPNLAWYFEVTDMPGYLGELMEIFYEKEDTSDYAISEYIKEILSLRAYDVFSLPAGHVIGSDNGGRMEDVYCQNSNLSIRFDMPDQVEVTEVQIIIDNIRLISASQYATPTVSFTVRALKEDYSGDSRVMLELKNYLTQSSFEGIKVGQIVALNPAVSVQFVERVQLGDGSFSYSLVPYVSDNGTMYEYRQDEDNKIMYAIWQGEEVRSDEVMTANVEIEPTFWESLSDKLQSNIPLVAGVLGGALVLGVGGGVLGWALTRRRKIKNAAKAARKQNEIASKRK